MLPELSENEARARIARRIAAELEDGALVNLGIGIPQLVPHYLPEGVRFLHRSPQLDRNETLGREIYDAFTAEVDADIYVLAHATSPFIRPETIAVALHKVTGEGYDSAFSAERLQTFAWFKGEPLNYSLDTIPRTQEIEPVFVETSAFFIFRREVWCGLHQRIGRRPYTAVVDRIEGIDIDYPEDFALAEVIAPSRKL